MGIDPEIPIYEQDLSWARCGGIYDYNFYAYIYTSRFGLGGYKAAVI
jgi:hypothetical protein